MSILKNECGIFFFLFNTVMDSFPFVIYSAKSNLVNPYSTMIHDYLN